MITNTQADEERALREQIGRESDVRRVLELTPIGGGRFRYLIETPFATFPRFVIGTTDAENEDVRIELKCGAEWNARQQWAERQVAA
jgi:hypothetical protein